MFYCIGSHSKKNSLNMKCNFYEIYFYSGKIRMKKLSSTSVKSSKSKNKLSATVNWNTPIKVNQRCLT